MVVTEEDVAGELTTLGRARGGDFRALFFRIPPPAADEEVADAVGELRGVVELPSASVAFWEASSAAAAFKVGLAGITRRLSLSEDASFERSGTEVGGLPPLAEDASAPASVVLEEEFAVSWSLEGGRLGGVFASIMERFPAFSSLTGVETGRTGERIGLVLVLMLEFGPTLGEGSMGEVEVVGDLGSGRGIFGEGSASTS